MDKRIVMIGIPGVGKTTLLSKIVKILTDNKKIDSEKIHIRTKIAEIEKEIKLSLAFFSNLVCTRDFISFDNKNC